MTTPRLGSAPRLYMLVHVSTGHFYIGSTRNMQRRYYEHMSDLRNNKHGNPRLQELFNVDDHIAFTVTEVDSYDEAAAREIAEIARHRDNPKCLNVHSTQSVFSSERAAKISASMKGHPVSEDTRRRIGEAAKGNTYWVGRRHTEESRKKMAQSTMGNQYAKGHTKTPEGIAKIRATHLGRKHTDEMRLKVSLNSASSKAVIVDGTKYRTFKLAGEALGVSSDTIRRRVADHKFPEYKLDA